jgi:hypothetical protein
MAVFKIPVTNTNQKLQVTLNGITYNFIIVWNQFGNCWYLDINDISNNPILNSIPLRAGYDLLKQFKYLGIGGHLIVQNTSNPLLEPGYSDFGQTSFLLYIPYAT